MLLWAKRKCLKWCHTLLHVHALVPYDLIYTTECRTIINCSYTLKNITFKCGLNSLEQIFDLIVWQPGRYTKHTASLSSPQQHNNSDKHTICTDSGTIPGRFRGHLVICTAKLTALNQTQTPPVIRHLSPGAGQCTSLPRTRINAAVPDPGMLSVTTGYSAKIRLCKFHRMWNNTINSVLGHDSAL